MNQDKKYDVRLIERHLDNGTITEKELEEHMASLPDVADKAVRVEITQPIVEMMRQSKNGK
ncbi:MAG: hypothetical protein WC966_05660 [Bradymonadales bacterium]|jgi:hypothetical protein